MPEPKRYTLDLLKSIDTKSVEEEVRAFDDPEAEHIQNTGIERGGGIGSIYEVETAHPDTGYNLCDRGDCESATPPMVRGETVPVTSSATFLPDATQFYAGVQSYRFTKTIAAGTYAYILLTDSSSNVDMHGFLPGQTVTKRFRLRIPSGGILGSECTFYIYDYAGGGWQETNVSAQNLYDQWQEVTVTRTLRAGATGVQVLFFAASTAALNEYFNVDEVEILTQDYFVTKRNKLLSAHMTGAIRDVKIDSRTVGQISAYGVEVRRQIAGADDAVVSSQAGYLVTAKLAGQVVTLSNVLLSTGAVAASRTITFTVLAGLSSYTSLSIVRKDTQTYANTDWEFIVRIGERCLLLKEGTPTYANIKFSNATEYTIREMCAYGGGMAFGTTDGKVFSVDSVGRYRYPNGKGTGTGPFNNGDAIGAKSIGAMLADGTMLYVADATFTGRVASWDGSAWRRYDGSGGGSGPYSAGAVIGIQAINAIAKYGNYIVFAGGAGNVGSWDTVALDWKTYAGVGTGGGPYGAGPAIGASTINSLAVSGATLAVGGANGRVGNWNGAAWTTYLGGGAGVEPFDNATVIGANDILSMTYFGTILVVAGVGGRLGNFDAGAWTTYAGAGAGVEPFSNAAVVGTFQITGLAVYGSTLLVLGNENAACFSGRLGSWDGAAWIDYLGAGAGTGLYSDSAKSFTFGPCRRVVVNTHLFFAGYGQAVYVYNDTAASWETVHSGLHVPLAHFGAGITGTPRVLTYRSTTGQALYYVLSHGQNISSFDGIDWAYWDGTGTGTGPYDAATVIGANAIQALTQYGVHLVVGGAAGQLGSWDGAAWKTSAGAGAGTGPYDNATVIGANAIQAMCTYSTFLVVSGVGGRTGSWDGAAWKTYAAGGAGTGPYDNATAIGAESINAICAYSTFLIIAGGAATGRLGSWDGAAWKTYAGAGAGTGPYNNNTVSIGNPINALLWWKTFLVVGGSSGKLGSWDGTNWKACDGTLTGTGPYNGGTMFNPVAATQALAAIGEILYAFSLYGSMGSWDGTAWRNSDGTGTGSSAYHTGESSPVVNLYSVTHWNGGIVPAPARGAYAVFASSERAGIQALMFQQLRIPEARLSQLFAWKFEDDSYLVGLTGNTESVFYLISSAGVVQPVLARYAVMQTSAGYTRALLYGTPTWYDTHLEAVGIVGYTDFVTYTPIVQYPAFSDRIDTASQALIGPGSLDMTYTKFGVSTQAWSVYSPAFAAAETSLISIIQSGTNTLIGAYGKLTNAYGLPAAVEFRLLWIAGSPTTLSGAVVDGIEDTLGVLLSEVGGVEEGYTPSIKNNVILYRSAGRLTVLSIGTSPSPIMQKVDDRLYKLNTLHPLNLYDDEAEALAVSSCDFNGRSLFYNTATPAATAQKFAAVIYTAFASGIDVGDKLVYHTTLDSAAYKILGHRLPALAAVLPGFGVDVFLEDVYYRTTLNDGSELADPLKADTLYLTSTDLPIPIGWTYGETVAVGEAVTVFLAEGRDVYVFGNQVAGQQSAFQLFGQRYLFDGFTVWLAVFEGAVYTRRERMAPGTGLSFIGVSATAAFFLSAYDNSLYTFDGGRTLSKGARFSAEATITRGLWNTRDNALILECADRFLWVRDAIVTKNLKKAAQTSVSLYDTTAGIVITNASYRWRYPYVTEATATAVPLTWQSAYFGTPGNQKTVLTEWVVALFDSAKAAASITFTCRSFDTERLSENTRVVTIRPADWTGSGFRRIRVRPPIAKGLGQSIQIDTTSHLLIQEVVAETVEEAKGLVPSDRSA